MRLDEEHGLGARVTLEEGGHTAPWSITCGIYGLMAHTVFCSSEPEARATLERLKARLLEVAALDGDPQVAGVGCLVDEF